MKFIKVNGLDNHIYYIATDKILWITHNGSGAFLVITEKDAFKTKETPEQIIELIEKAGATNEQ